MHKERTIIPQTPVNIACAFSFGELSFQNPPIAPSKTVSIKKSKIKSAPSSPQIICCFFAKPIPLFCLQKGGGTVLLINKVYKGSIERMNLFPIFNMLNRNGGWYHFYTSHSLLPPTTPDKTY